MAIRVVMLQKVLPRAQLMIVNRSEHEFIRQRIHEHNVDSDAVELISATYRSMPDLIAKMTAGVFFIKPCFSKSASAPTRLGEFLACGIPCLGNTGVGDVEQILLEAKVGVCVNGFDDAELSEAVRKLVRLTQTHKIETRCTAAAEKYFSLQRGVNSYSRIYHSF